MQTYTLLTMSWFLSMRFGFEPMCSYLFQELFDCGFPLEKTRDAMKKPHDAMKSGDFEVPKRLVRVWNQFVMDSNLVDTYTKSRVVDIIDKVYAEVLPFCR